mgnify:CR=1 FL=1
MAKSRVADPESASVSGSVHRCTDSRSYLEAAGAANKDWTSQQFKEIPVTFQRFDNIVLCLSCWWNPSHRFGLYDLCTLYPRIINWVLSFESDE